MKTYLINAFVIVVLLFLMYKIAQTDVIDRTKPFGTDSGKNQKFAKGKVGEDFGVNTYWGRPSKTDTNQKRLDKIQWLSHTPVNDVEWRRTFIFAVIFSLSGALALGIFDYKHIFTLLFIIFIAIYTYASYYKHHLLARRTKFVDIHIKNLKEDLKLSLTNKISSSMII